MTAASVCHYVVLAPIADSESERHGRGHKELAAVGRLVTRTDLHVVEVALLNNHVGGSLGCNVDVIGVSLGEVVRDDVYDNSRASVLVAARNSNRSLAVNHIGRRIRADVPAGAGLRNREVNLRHIVWNRIGNLEAELPHDAGHHCVDVRIRGWQITSLFLLAGLQQR